jgi:ketosteroid isomerase-like protein
MGGYRSLLDRYVERYNAGDLDAVMDLYAEDAVQLMPDGTEGRSAIRDRLAGTDASRICPSRRQLRRVGDAFADEWVFVGTHTGPVGCPTAPRCLNR